MTRDALPLKNTPWTLGLPMLAVFLLLQLTTIPQRIDFWLYDTLTTHYPSKVSNDVALVAIDEYSLAQLGRWPWPRTFHAELIRKLDQAGARVIVFDVLFPEPSPDDTEMAEAMDAHGNVVLPLHLSPPSEGQLMAEQFPTRELLSSAAALGHAHVELDRDGLARGLYLLNGLGSELWPSLGLAAYDQRRNSHPKVVSRDDAPAPYMNVRQHYVGVPLAGRAGTMPSYSYARVLESPPAPGIFRGKTVFIGATAAGFGDILPTPFSSLSRPMSGVEFHANSYSALVQGTLFHPVPAPLALGLTLLTILVLAISLPRLRPTRTFVLCLALAVTLVACHIVLLFGPRFWLPISSALLMPMIAFPLSSARRLAMTNRFLNRQLDELGRGRQMTLTEPRQRHPTQLLEHFRSLFEPAGWLLAEDDVVIAAKHLSVADRPDLSAPGQWVHNSNQSWIRLVRGPATYDLGLELSNDLSRDATQRYLRRLTLNTRQETQETEQPQENISAQIERIKQATKRMNGMQEFIRRSFEHMPDGIIVTDELGVIQFANGHIEEWFGEPMPSLSGMPLTRLLEGHDPRETAPWHETISETLTLHQSRTVDLGIRGKDFLIHFAPFELPGSQQNGIIANISDISELREQQRQHREAIDFISHDVRSPLVSQLALIEQLKRHPGEILPDQMEQLGRLARRSYQLAEEFVQLARAEQLTETRFYECEFLAIVENARDSVSEQAAEKGIHMVLQGGEDLWLRGNAELLERAVINLLTNAVQYSDSGSTITIQVFLAGHQACLTIADEGSGIAPDELPHLFDRYRRQKSSELSGSRGAGLGLSFVNVVVEKHRGEIRVSSRLGEGSTFTLKLPVADPLP